MTCAEKKEAAYSKVSLPHSTKRRDGSVDQFFTAVAFHRRVIPSPLTPSSAAAVAAAAAAAKATDFIPRRRLARLYRARARCATPCT